jgi:hypothetical protein
MKFLGKPAANLEIFLGSDISVPPNFQATFFWKQ